MLETMDLYVNPCKRCAGAPCVACFLFKVTFKPFSCHSAVQRHGVDDYHPPTGVLVRPTGALPVNKGPAMSGGWGWLTG